MKLSTSLNQFFVQYLPRIKGSSEKTIHAYRDTYRLLLPFAADYHQKPISKSAWDTKISNPPWFTCTWI
jgi:hypothetical protein